MEPWRLLSELCNPGLCMVDAPAAIPRSALAIQPATTQSAPKSAAAQQNLNMQLKPQEDSQQVGGETIHTCKLQVDPLATCMCLRSYGRLRHLLASIACSTPFFMQYMASDSATIVFSDKMSQAQGTKHNAFKHQLGKWTHVKMQFNSFGP